MYLQFRPYGPSRLTLKIVNVDGRARPAGNLLFMQLDTKKWSLVHAVGMRFHLPLHALAGCMRLHPDQGSQYAAANTAGHIQQNADLVPHRLGILAEHDTASIVAYTGENMDTIHSYLFSFTEDGYIQCHSAIDAGLGYPLNSASQLYIPRLTA